MAAQTISYEVVVLSARHSISGELLLRDQRLSDLLNDRRDSAITLLNAKVARLSDPGKILQQHGVAVVPKTWAVIAFEPPQKAIPPSKRIYGYVKKQTHDVFLILDTMEVRGLLHTSSDLDPRRLMATATEHFLPITQAVVTFYANERFIIEQEAIMVNGQQIRYIAETKSNS